MFDAVGIRVVTPFGFLGRYQRFSGTYCLHIQGCLGVDMALKPEININIFIGVSTRDLLCEDNFVCYILGTA